MKKIARLLGLERERGLELQRSFPFVRTFFKGGLTEQMIAELLYQNRDFCRAHDLDKCSTPSLRNIVNLALVGNKYNNGPVYTGLMSQREHRRYAKKHMSMYRKNGSDVVNKTGMFAQTSEQRSARALESVDARGQTRWSYYEESLAWELKDQGYKNWEIAQVLNSEVHGKEARTTYAVGRVIRN